MWGESANNVIMYRLPARRFVKVGELLRSKVFFKLESDAGIKFLFVLTIFFTELCGDLISHLCVIGHYPGHKTSCY